MTDDAQHYKPFCSDAGGQIPTPAEWLGFEVGADRKLAGWEQIAGYFRRLEAMSERVRTLEIGSSTEGNPFLMAIISSPQNLANLDEFKHIQERLADPRTIVDDAEAERLIAAGRAVVAIGCSIHATEVGATQMSTLLVHHMATANDSDTQRILDEVILLLIPCLNPDGLVKVKNWYESTLGEPHEGMMPPFLYQKYTGHDNNRDWYMFTQQETKVVLEHCLNAWHPHIFFDMHQTRSNGVRMILPPFVDPVGPNVNPVLQAQTAMLGTAIAADLTAAGKAGVAVNVVYDSYSPNRTYLHYHGGVRLLSELAGVKIASPVKLNASDLRTDRGETPTERTWRHPLPWDGGTWRLRDIVEYDFDAALSCLRHAARLRGSLVRNFFGVGRDAVAAAGKPYAYVVPTAQHDGYAAAEMLGALSNGLVEIHEAKASFSADGHHFAAGSRVILRGQPYWAYAKTLMEQLKYPEMKTQPNGMPKQPYDVTAHCMPIQMGVNAYAIERPFAANLRLLADDEAKSAAFAIRRRAGRKAKMPELGACIIPAESNAAARVVNRLQAADVSVARTTQPFTAGGVSYGRGAFVALDGNAAFDAIDSASEDALQVNTLGGEPSVPLRPMREPRVGVYKSHIPAMEEGWTRFVLDEYGFEYESLSDADVRAGELRRRFDAVVLPHQPVRHIHRGHGTYYHPAYTGGLGDGGAAELRRFVDDGGTLVTWDGSSRYAIRHLELPVRNVLADLKRIDFYAPGSLLAMLLDTSHPIAYGMPSLAAVMFYDSPAFDIREGWVVGKYPLRNPLFSGLLVGAENLFGRTALASVPLGKGEVVLMGFRPNFRAQARGTYKLLFNALYASAYDAE